jgi:enoyl-CoA hydratase/carnithine racemase
MALDDDATWMHLAIERPGRRWCRVTFDHPPDNAVTARTVAELDELVALAAGDRDLDVVVFASAHPDVFLGDAEGDVDPAAWTALLDRLAALPTVTIAALGGRAHGLGAELALACDLRIAARGQARLGSLTAAAAARLARLLGPDRAADLLGEGDGGDLDAARIAESVVDPDRLAVRSASLAQARPYADGQ